jgi:hypothetical protein
LVKWVLHKGSSASLPLVGGGGPSWLAPREGPLPHSVFLLRHIARAVLPITSSLHRVRVCPATMDARWHDRVNQMG